MKDSLTAEKQSIRKARFSRRSFEVWLKSQPEELAGGQCPISHFLGRERYAALYNNEGGDCFPRWARNLIRSVDFKNYIHWAGHGKPYPTSAVWKALKGCGRVI